MKLEYIEFALENCDVIEVNGKHIGTFLVDKIEPYFYGSGGADDNYVVREEVAKSIVIEIKKEANVLRYPFDDRRFCKCERVFDRLSYGDICSISFALSGNGSEKQETKKYSFYTNWSGENEFINEAQVNYVDELGNMYLTIEEGKSTSDFFNLEK